MSERNLAEEEARLRRSLGPEHQRILRMLRENAAKGDLLAGDAADAIELLNTKYQNVCRILNEYEDAAYRARES